MQRGTCALCSRRLVLETVLIDRDGRSYHLSCWVRMMDVRIQESQDAIQKRKAWPAARRRSARKKRAGHKPNDSAA